MDVLWMLLCTQTCTEQWATVQVLAVWLTQAYFISFGANSIKSALAALRLYLTKCVPYLENWYHQYMWGFSLLFLQYPKPFCNFIWPLGGGCTVGIWYYMNTPVQVLLNGTLGGNVMPSLTCVTSVSNLFTSSSALIVMWERWIPESIILHDLSNWMCHWGLCWLSKRDRQCSL